MHMQWILSPITFYATVALALGGCLALFISTKVELQAVRRMATSVRAEVQGIREEVEQHDEQAESLPAPVAVMPSAAGLGPNKRAQAIRMYRRGEAAPDIAATLHAPQAEIQLLLKIHSLMNPQK